MRETKPLKWMTYFVAFVHGAKATVLMRNFDAFALLTAPCLAVGVFGSMDRSLLRVVERW